MRNGPGTHMRSGAVRYTHHSPPSTHYFFFPLAGGAAGFAVASVNAMFWPT